MRLKALASWSKNCTSVHMRQRRKDQPLINGIIATGASVFDGVVERLGIGSGAKHAVPGQRGARLSFTRNEG